MTINNLELYRDAGRQSAIARNNGDEARSKFEYEFKNKMVRLEKLEDRLVCQQAYDEAYKMARSL